MDTQYSIYACLHAIHANRRFAFTNMNYLSLSGECRTLKVIEKSKFITTSAHVEGEDAARAFIASISKEFADATHNCYAYICDSTGNFLRFSDDGEPSGTAGMPMLEVLKAKKLVQVAVVVTRYFGGIKLGAGGLVRAYSGSVAENLNEAKLVSYEECAEGEYSVDYSLAELAKRYFSQNDCSLINTAYDSGVTFTVAVRAVEEAAFDGALINALNGKVKISPKRRYHFPFELV